MTLYVDGLQRRALETWVYPNGKRYSFDGAFDGTHTTYLDPAGRPNVRQGDIFGNITRLTSLRAHPRVPNSGPFVLEDIKPDGQIRLSQGPWRIQVLQSSGLVREARSRSSADPGPGSRRGAAELRQKSGPGKVGAMHLLSDPAETILFYLPRSVPQSMWA